MLLAFSTPRLDAPGDALLIELQRQQYLHPHWAIREMLDNAGNEVGFCRDAARRAVRLLGLDSTAKIGRLEEDRLVELSRMIRRLCGRPGAAMHPASVA